MSFIFNWICSFFFLICSFQFNFSSKCKPRYFTTFFCGICILFKNIGGQVSLHKVNVIFVDFNSLIWIFHF
uniref:Putative product n=1 Tax=Xenopsylla cheopis TaxID=163159 RepID=A0A6M2DVT4_XENCH